jgi:L-threonylcarbamoyladenylate synthase
MPGPSLLTVDAAAQCLGEGGIIAYPTEAVYGLGCDPGNEPAVRSVLALKGRPASSGLILIGECYEHFQPFIGPVSAEQRERALAAWPGPVTWLFPRAAGVPDWLAGSHDTIAVRLTAHPLCRALCKAFGGAIVSTSANPRGQPPACTAQAVRSYFGDNLAGIVEGELGGGERPSEIRDLASGRIIRES